MRQTLKVIDKLIQSLIQSLFWFKKSQMCNQHQIDFQSELDRTDYDCDFKVLPEVYPPVIDLLISLLTALRRIYKPVIDNIIHKMIVKNLNFYLEEITESSRNTNRIKELKSIKNNQIFHVRQITTSPVILMPIMTLILNPRQNQTMTVTLILNKFFKSKSREQNFELRFE